MTKKMKRKFDWKQFLSEKKQKRNEWKKVFLSVEFTGTGEKTYYRV